MKKVFLVLVLGGILGAAGYAGVYVHSFLTTPPDVEAAERIVLITPGTPVRGIAETLHQESVISDKNLFMLLARFYNEGKSMKAGEYRFTTSMLPTEVLDILQEGKIYFRSATIPEGYTMYQVAKLLAEEGFGAEERFLELMTDKAFIAELKIEADTLEGYLYPDTYYIHRGMNEQDILRKMVQEFWQVMTPDLQQEITQKGFTIHEIVTLASIVEKEAMVAEEREIISAVYHNRLRINMKLDSDPTVIYGLKNFDGNLTKTDLKKKTPYNTYRTRGLPPGPIANPGKPCILAAVRPADVKYLYFVARSDGDGTHKFSNSYKEHLRAVREYQKRRK